MSTVDGIDDELRDGRVGNRSDAVEEAKCVKERALALYPLYIYTI